jgi:amino acid transporter
MKWLEILVQLAAIFGLTSVILVNLYGQSRIFYSMAKDGLLTPAFTKTHLLKKRSGMGNTALSSATTTVTTEITNNIDSVRTTVTITPEIQLANKPAGSPVWASIVTGE